MTEHDRQPREGCKQCAVLWKRNRRLQSRLRFVEQKLRRSQWQVNQLARRVLELEQRLNRNSTNSSLPPSANPPQAPKPARKQPTGRRIGAQKGHPGHGRKPLPPQQVDHFIQHRPSHCQHCLADLPAGGGQMTARHQVMDLPPRGVIVTEHQALSVCCPHCQQITRGAIPPELRVSVVGERLAAALCLLSSRLHGSRRSAVELLGEVLGAPLSLGSVSAREQEMSRALAGDYQQLKKQVRRAPVKYVDETGWKRAAGFIWVAGTARAAVFHLDRGRHRGALATLLGEEIRGVLCTDRYGTYEQHPPLYRQLCWSHLKRDFVAQQERAGPAGRWGTAALAVTREMFELWHRFKARAIGRCQLQRLMRPLRQRMHRLLVKGHTSGIGLLVGLCRNLLRLERALWTFVRVANLEPTNNHAERMLRPAVQWRKKCLGSHSEAGCRFVERMLSVIHTCRLRKRSVMEHLAGALRRYRHELPLLKRAAPALHVFKLPA